MCGNSGDLISKEPKSVIALFPKNKITEKDLSQGLPEFAIEWEVV
jgi:hypothetical protein